MQAHVYTAALGACLLLFVPSVIAKEGEGEQEGQTNEAEKLERARHKLRVGPEDAPEGPAKRDPDEHIDEHLRTQNLLDRHPLKIPDRFEKKK